MTMINDVYVNSDELICRVLRSFLWEEIIPKLSHAYKYVTSKSTTTVVQYVKQSINHVKETTQS